MKVSKCWKIAEFPKISIKMKNCKTFKRPTQRVALRKLFSLSSPDKSFLRLWNKNFLKEIYRNTQTFAFKVLRECSSWASRNGVVQMFFCTQTRNMFAGKFVKWERFLAVLSEHIFSNVEWVEFYKMSEVFWAKLYCKMSDLFC